MINYTELSGKHTEFLAMTGLSVEEFDALLPSFKKAVSERKVTIEGKIRERKPVIYKNSPLSSEADQLLFILTYMKQYMTQTAIGALFGITQPKANALIHYLTPALSDALRESGASPCRDMGDLNYENDFLNDEESCVYCHDATERQINRPKGKEKQKKNYSGKKRSMRLRTA